MRTEDFYREQKLWNETPKITIELSQATNHVITVEEVRAMMKDVAEGSIRLALTNLFERGLLTENIDYMFDGKVDITIAG
jgi:predicted transcriptional regulator of viral defense system